MVRRPGWRGDVAAVVGAFAAVAFLLAVGDASTRSTPPWPVDATIGAAGCVALSWRRRWPLGIAAAIAATGAVAASATAPMAVAMFTLAALRRGRVVLPVALASWAGVVVYFGLQRDPLFPVWVDLAVRGGIIGGAVGWGRYARAHRDLVASLRERAAQLEAQQQLRIDQARLTERARIAREMHDVLAHRLSLVSLHAGALEVRADARPEEMASAAGVIRANAHEALMDLRAVIGVLRDGEGTGTGPQRPQPGLSDVPSLVADAREAGAAMDYSVAVDDADLPATTGRTAFRVVQEALTNARKHAPGAAVQVQVQGAPGDGLWVRVSNPVTAPASVTGKPPGAGLGLVGLAERVSLAGGRLAHGIDGPQFQIEAWLPWTK